MAPNVTSLSLEIAQRYLGDEVVNVTNLNEELELVGAKVEASSTLPSMPYNSNLDASCNNCCF